MRRTFAARRWGAWLVVILLSCACVACSPADQNGAQDGAPAGSGGSPSGAGGSSDGGPADDGQDGPPSGSDVSVDSGPIDPTPYELHEVACTDPIPRSALCGSLCGNGAVDKCTVMFGTQPFDAFEVCDGAVPGGMTCASLGYEDGQLACGSWCGLDVGSCTMCADDSHVADCQDRLLNHPGLALFDAATGGSRAALLARGNQSQLSFVGADFSAVAPERCFQDDIRRVVHTPSGWLLSAEYPGFGSGNPSVVSLAALDEDGNRLGPVKLVAGYLGTTLVERPGGGPFLIGYRDPPSDPNAGMRSFDAIQLDEAGQVLWTAHVFDDFPAARPPAAVATDAGLLVIGNQKIFKVGSTGIVAEPYAYPFTPLPEYLQLAWSGKEARLSWVDVTAPGVYLARLDADGAAIGAPVRVAEGFVGNPGFSGAGAEMLIAGSRTYVTLQGFPIPGARRALAGLVVDDELNVIVPLFPIARSPMINASAIRMVGTDVIVAWSGDPGSSFAPYQGFPRWLGVARLKP